MDYAQKYDIYLQFFIKVVDNWYDAFTKKYFFQL